MDDAPPTNVPIDWRRQFLWLHLFRAFRIAVDPRKMLLAGIGLLCLTAGDSGINRLPFAPEEAELTANWPWETPAGWGELADTFRNGEEALPRLAAGSWRVVLQPFARFVEPARLLFHPELDWPRAAYAMTRLLWTLLVWSFFGGALTRMAALQFARDERIGMREALRYSASRLMSYFTAPLLPLAAVACFWVLCLLGGWIGLIPVVGDIVVGAFYFLALFFGLLMALILIGVGAGWPLMFATISAEGSDGFDGLSRSYNYVYDRPWHYAWYCLVAVVYGGIVIAAVTVLVALTVYLAAWGVGSGLGDDRMIGLYSAAPQELGGTQAWYGVAQEPPGIGAMLAGVWLNLAALLQAGFVHSYFWCVMTIVYFLLRKSADGANLNEVYVPEKAEEDELLPLVGVAASDQPVIERPPPEMPESDAPDSTD